MSGDATSTDAADAVAASDSATPAVTLPQDAAEWRSLIKSLPSRELQQTILKNKPAATRIFAGFRPGPETLHRALVVQRIVEHAQKDPEFAADVAGLKPIPTASPAAEPEEKTQPFPKTQPHPPLAAPQSVTVAEDPRLRDKVKEQRAALREKDVRIAQLEASIADTQRERDALRTAAAEAYAARKAAETDAQRERRQRGRDVRREEASLVRHGATAAASAARPAVAAAPVSTPAPTPNGLLVEGLQRLLSRGRYAIVAETCREALAAAESGLTATALARGRVHALFAVALYGLGESVAGGEQDIHATRCLLDAGELILATEALGRILIHATNLKSSALHPAFKRLYALSEKMQQIAAVRDALTHVRVGSAEANRRLRAALVGNDSSAATERSSRLVQGLLQTGGDAHVGPDEQIALPVPNANAATVTPRRIVTAIDAGDAAYIARVRDGIHALQNRAGADSAIANALLESIAALDPMAVQPLLQASNHPIVVDASNVVRHNPDPLSLSPTRRVIHLQRMRDYLLRRGFFPIIAIADANLRFHVDDRATYLDLITRGIVRETPPGTSADEELISEARHRGAPLITNDRLSEWGDAASGVERLGFALLADGVSLTPF